VLVNEIGGSTYHPAPPFQRQTLVALVARMQRLRWQRAAPLTPLAVPLVEADMQTLHHTHARATVGFECWPGWTDLLDAAWLAEIAPESAWAPDQIKEKYATLRFYWHGDLPELGSEIIEAAEHISGHICEVCGALGGLQNRNSWWSTRCPDHKHWRPA
jgi:hypothetical protein